MFASILIILLICYIASISYYSIKNDFDLFYSSNINNITIENTKIYDIYNKYYYDHHGKKYNVKYDRIACEKDIEEYACFKYKFYIHGFLEIFCRPENITYGINSIDCNDWLEYYGDKVERYYGGYNNVLITQEHFLKKDNITEEKLNHIFQFNTTQKFLIQQFLDISIPKSKYNIKFYGDYKGHYKLDCNRFDTLIKQEKIIEYHYEYKTNITISTINIINYCLFSLFIFDFILLVYLFVFKKCIVRSVSNNIVTVSSDSDMVKHNIHDNNIHDNNVIISNIDYNDCDKYQTIPIQPLESNNLNIYPFVIYYNV